MQKSLYNIIYGAHPKHIQWNRYEVTVNSTAVPSVSLHVNFEDFV